MSNRAQCPTYIPTCDLCMEPLPKGRRKFCSDKCRRDFTAWARSELRAYTRAKLLFPAGAPSAGGPQ